MHCSPSMSENLESFVKLVEKYWLDTGTSWMMFDIVRR